MPDAADLTKRERSTLLYAESCAVDGGGLLDSARMNADDMTALKKFEALGWLDFGRIPGRCILARPSHITPTLSHWVELKPVGWERAGACRRLRAQQRGPFAQAVFEEVNS